MATKKKVTPQDTADTTIMSVWNQSGDEKKAEDLALNLQLLQSDAETTLIMAKQNVAKKGKAVRDSMTNAAKDPKFGPIATARLELRAAQLELDDASIVYAELFGTTPSIAK